MPASQKPPTFLALTIAIALSLGSCGDDGTDETGRRDAGDAMDAPGTGAEAGSAGGRDGATDPAVAPPDAGVDAAPSGVDGGAGDATPGERDGGADAGPSSTEGGAREAGATSPASDAATDGAATPWCTRLAACCPRFVFTPETKAACDSRAAAMDDASCALSYRNLSCD